MNTLVYISNDIKVRQSDIKIMIDNDMYFPNDLYKYKSIMLITNHGYISIQSLYLLSRLGKPITISNLNGAHVYDLIPAKQFSNYEIKIKQIKALDFKDIIANKIIQQKQINYNSLLQNYNLKTFDISINEKYFSRYYFKELSKQFLQYGYDFRIRKGFYGMTNAKADNEINALLNFTYGYIEHKLLFYIDKSGLDYSISYLHNSDNYKLSLTYDIIELLRYKCDNIVLSMAKNKLIDKSLFDYTDYVKLKPDFIKKYVKIIDKHISVNDYNNVLNTFIGYLTVNN